MVSFDKKTMRQKKNIMPRHSASSMELKEGTVPITAMCPCGEFLEIYKVDKTFRVRSPESTDPDETNPYMPWITSPVDDVGSSSPIISLVLLQGYEILNAALFEKNIDKEVIIKILHSCKESLVACEKVTNRIAHQVDRIINQINTQGISKDRSGLGLNPFPQVIDLDTECGIFLIHANRAIKAICELPAAFMDLDKVDSNFDHLAKTLAPIMGQDSPLVYFITSNADGIRYIIDLRNFHEHPKKKKTIIDNFSLLPDMSIKVPMWSVSYDQPRPIKEEMRAVIVFLVEMAEAMLIHLVMALVVKGIPFIVERIEDSKIDQQKPIKYRLSLDFNKLKFE